MKMVRYSFAGVLLVSVVLVLIFGFTAQDETSGNPKKESQLMKPPDNACGAGKIFCEEVENYPEARIREILNRDKGKYADLFGEETKWSRIPGRMTDFGIQLCAGEERLYFPKVGVNDEEDKHYIVNIGEEFKQGIQLEICRNPDEACSLAEGFPSGYVTQCVQKYSHKKLLALEYGGDSCVVDNFKLPTCCICSVTGPFE
ncbi:protein spaetzle-like [Periplaneta americana]|uniref:protein spaetzle-like n=1 Tax=Periplaneta americana TaxID=6978 RepID=UPI0037E773D1